MQAPGRGNDRIALRERQSAVSPALDDERRPLSPCPVLDLQVIAHGVHVLLTVHVQHQVSIRIRDDHGRVRLTEREPLDGLAELGRA